MIEDSEKYCCQDEIYAVRVFEIFFFYRATSKFLAVKSWKIFLKELIVISI